MSDSFILDDGNPFILFGNDELATQTSYNTPFLNYYLRVDFSLKNLETETIDNIILTNREVITNFDCYPVLLGVDNLGAKMGDFIPESTKSTILISNKHNSLGSERRFSDLFDRYSIIDQSCIVYLAEKEIGNENIDYPSFNEVWRSVVTNVSVDADVIRVSLSRSIIPSHIVTKVISRVSFPDAPQESLGKYLPIVFSNTNELIEVQPLLIKERYEQDQTERLDYAYATTFSNQNVPSGIGLNALEVYTENEKREYQKITFANDPLTPVYDLPLTALSFSVLWGSVKEYGYALRAGQGVQGGEVIVGCDWFLASSTFSLTKPAGNYSYRVQVYSDNNGFPGTVLASDTLESSDAGIVYHDTVNTYSVFKFEFRFSKALIIPEGVEGLFITLSRNDASDTFRLFQAGSAPLSIPEFEKYVISDTTAGTDQGFVRYVQTNNRDHLRVFALSMTDDPNGGDPSKYQQGLGHAMFTIKSRDQDNIPEIGKLRFLAKTSGLSDDSLGSVSGAAYKKLNTPLEQIRLLLKRWNGSSWVEDVFNTSKFSHTWANAYLGGSRYRVLTSGATQGREIASSLIQDICRNGNTKVVPVLTSSSSCVGIWAWGTVEEPSFIIDDEKAKLIRYAIGGVESIINRVKMVYKRTLQTRVESLLSEGGLNNYQALLTNEDTFLDVPYFEVDKSLSLWGERELGNAQFAFITDEIGAKSVATMYLRNYNMPSFLVEVEVPYNQYFDLDCMSVGTLKMVNLPNFYGTTHEAKPVLASTNTDALDLLMGFNLKRAKSYKVRVLSNELVVNNDQGVKRVLLLKVLSNFMEG